MAQAYEPGTEVSRTLGTDTNVGRIYLRRSSHLRRRSSSNTLKMSNPIATKAKSSAAITRILRIVDNPNSDTRTDVIKPRQPDTFRQARAAPIRSAADFVADHDRPVGVRQ